MRKITVFPSAEASRAFSASSAPKLSAFSLSASTRTLEFSPADGLDAALASPTTEVVTAYGVEEGYEANMRKFAGLVGAELTGANAEFHGAAVGTTVDDISKEEGGEKGRAVSLFVGWDSREAHMAEKEQGGEFYPFLVPT